MRLPLPFPFTRIRSLLLEVPAYGKLAYCLLRDPEVPLAPKVALLAALGVVVSPIDLPAWVPLAGELDMLALGLLAVKVFVDACPEERVRANREALKRGDSVYNEDLSRAALAARRGALRLVERVRSGRALTTPLLEE